MRRLTLLVAALAGVISCIAGALGTKREWIGAALVDEFSVQGDAAMLPAAPHHMRGWVHRPPRLL